MRVAVIGAGIGGLTAAIRLAILGHRVTIFEARNEAGGLASGLEAGGIAFDGGPYIVLDRPGLEWAFEKIGADVADLQLAPVGDFYEVRRGEDRIAIHLDLARTAEGLERRWPGAGRAYEAFVAKMDAMRTRLTPMLRVSRPNVIELARRGSLAAAPFLLRSLGGVLSKSGLPEPLLDAIAIWTHIAGQDPRHAPSVMAFIPALVHRVGAFVPAGGMRAIPIALAARARDHGVELRFGSRVQRVCVRDGRVSGVQRGNDVFECDAVVSNYSTVGTYVELVDETPDRVRRRLAALPLQSPGLCAYVAASRAEQGPYLRFQLDESGRLTLRVTAPQQDRGVPVRVIRPVDHAAAMQSDDRAQEAELEAMTGESWWREGLDEPRVVASRTVRMWGRTMNLYRDSMNPAMTRRLMLRGRLAHRSPWVRGLFLAGASTHPGQWVSFCAISGILAADSLHATMR